MMNDEELNKSLSNDFFACLDRFFSIAASHGVKSMTLNCHTRKVDVEMCHAISDDSVDECPETYYRNMRSTYSGERKVKGIIGAWKKRQLVKPTVELYHKLLSKHLEELLCSNFLIYDEDVVVDMSRYKDELVLWGLDGKDYDHKYSMLRLMVNFDDVGFSVDEFATGNYLLSRREQLTSEGLKCFFDFVLLCELVYVKISELENVLSESDKSLLSRLLGYVERGDWQSPATCDNVKRFIVKLFNNKEFRDFFKGGKSGAETDRVEVSMANLLGYFMNYQLLGGGQKQVSNEFFGNGNHINNINKGKTLDGNREFKSLLPLMDNYRKKIIVL